MHTSPPGLYVHVPFCSSVCPYCDFAVTLAGEDRRAGWEGAVIEEASMYRGVFSPFDTVYLGGGTPSALAPERLARVLTGIRGELDIVEGAGLHLEVNPEDVEPEHVREWVAMGVVFASVGVQSLHDEALEFLGRRHTAADGKRAASLLLEAGVSTVSADLIFGLPGQTATRWRQQLESVVELGVSHVSCYQLTIHDGTAFARSREAGQLEEMAEDEQADLYLLAHQVLGDAGFEAYEVSNFARAGHRSRHNSKYWTGKPYLGLGPAAHSFDGLRRRWWNSRKLRVWRRQVADGVLPVAESEDLAALESAFEAVMLGLRFADGVDFGEVELRWGVEADPSSWQRLQRFADQGLLVIEGRRVRPTPRGMAVADALARSVDLVETAADGNRDV